MKCPLFKALFFWQHVICHEVSSPSRLFFLATEFFMPTILQLKVAKRWLFEKVSLERCLNNKITWTELFFGPEKSGCINRRRQGSFYCQTELQETPHHHTQLKFIYLVLQTNLLPMGFYHTRVCHFFHTPKKSLLWCVTFVKKHDVNMVF